MHRPLVIANETMAHGFVDRARERFELPVTHVVVDLVRHEEYVAAA